MRPNRKCSTPGCERPGKLLGRLYHPDGSHTYLGYFCCAKERTEAQVLARVKAREVEREAQVPRGDRLTCDQYATEYLVRMASGALLTRGDRPYKRSSIDSARTQLKRFTAEFGERPLTSITRYEANRWAESHGRKQSVLQWVMTLFRHAVDEQLVDSNPFQGEIRKPAGRGDQAPPD